MINSQTNTSTLGNVQPVRMYEREFNRHLHQNFARLRQDAPVAPAFLTRGQKVFLINRYEDVVLAFKDERILKNPRAANGKSESWLFSWMLKGLEPLLHNMLNTDEPDHRRLRNLVHKAFTPHMINGLAPRIEAISHNLLDRAMAKGTVDLMEDFALPLPVTVIAEMIGVPEADRPRFLRLSERIVVSPTPLNMIGMIPATWQMVRYIRKLAEMRRRDPKDDLASALALAEDEGDQFTEDELVSMIFLLLLAGYVTTVNLIGNGVYSLLTHPEQLTLLRQNPALMESAVEEMLRYESPVITAELSFAREEFELHGVIIPKGGVVLPALLSANRDETVFPQPNRFDIQRTPNRHLAFGQGIHYCLGAPLARLEGQIAIQALLERSPDLQFAVDRAKIEYKNVMMLHGLDKLPVKLA